MRVGVLAGHNGFMAGRIGRLRAFFGRAEPRAAPPSGWALTFDVAVAVGAAAGAVYELAARSVTTMYLVDGPPPLVAMGGLGRIIARSAPLHPSTLMLIAAAMTALPLAARRLYPITVWLAIIAAILVLRGTFVPQVALGTAVYAAYSAVVHSRYRNLAIAAIAVVLVATDILLGNELPRFPGRLTAVFAIVPAAALGLGIRELRRRLADSTARLQRAAAEHEAATVRALAAERARIAGELHDVVTHNVAVMVVQAGAARTVLASSPADAAAALLAVEASGRAAMAELRSLLGLLSPPAGDYLSNTAGRTSAAEGLAAGDGGPAGPDMGGWADSSVGAGVGGGNGARATAASRIRATPADGTSPASYVMLSPQPGLSELDVLISRVSAAGLPVQLCVSGEPRPLTPGADLAAYRVVQEALTNVLRHAGRAVASVAVRWDENLVITIRDDGGGGGRPPTAGVVLGSASGRGLLGLRERLSLYGGELDAGPLTDGGWQVQAVLPA